MVAGDDTLADEIEEWIPWARHVIVKQAFGRNAAASLHPLHAQRLIAEEAVASIRRAAAGELTVLEVVTPVQIDVDYQSPAQADYAAFVPGAVRVGERGVSVEGVDAAGAFRSFLCGVRLSGLVAH